jgi:replicative DNA helicase
MSKEPNIEQDPSGYAAWCEKMERIKGHSELIVAKQRHGATGKVRLYFDSRITKFSDLADNNFADDHD